MSYRIPLVAIAAFALVGCADTMSPNPSTDDAPKPGETVSFGSAVGGKGDQLQTSIDPSDCPGGEPRRVDGRPAAWTLVVWSAGDNNLEEQLVDDINEMERGHGGSPNVNVLVQLDRRSEDGSWRYRIRPGDNPDEIESKLVGHSDEELDSGNWKNYAAFGEWATVCYPAQRYMTVIEGHGGGWSAPEGESEEDGDTDRSSGRARNPDDPARLIAPDDTDGTEMSIPGLRSALQHIRQATRREGDPEWRNRLSLYGSDACLMQTIEVLDGLENTARFVVGSAENEPGPGWPYYTVIEDLTTRPFYYAQTPRELGGALVENYGSSYGSRGGQGDSKDYTLAVADTRHVDDVVEEFADVSELLLEMMDELRPHLAAARDEALRYGDSWYSDGVYIDAVAFLAHLRSRLVERDLMPADGEHWEGDERWRTLRDEIDTLLDTVDRRLLTDAVFGPDISDVSGLSVFAPTSADAWRKELSSYSESRFASETGWDEVVQKAFVE